jgi:hypothetical protein
VYELKYTYIAMPGGFYNNYYYGYKRVGKYSKHLKQCFGKLPNNAEFINFNKLFRKTVMNEVKKYMTDAIINKDPTNINLYILNNNININNKYVKSRSKWMLYELIHNDPNYKGYLPAKYVELFRSIVLHIMKITANECKQIKEIKEKPKIINTIITI